MSVVNSLTKPLPYAAAAAVSGFAIGAAPAQLKSPLSIASLVGSGYLFYKAGGGWGIAAGFGVGIVLGGLAAAVMLVGEVGLNDGRLPSPLSLALVGGVVSAASMAAAGAVR